MPPDTTTPESIPSMTTATMTAGATAPEPETEPRIAIWSLSARVIGAYFVIFLLQYAPGVALEAYTQWPPAADGALAMAQAAVAIVKGSGPIGMGAATNALAIAMIVEGAMVLAKIISMHQREEGFRQGRTQGREEGLEQGIEQERERRNKANKQRNAKLRALAEKYGIPESELPIADVDSEDDGA